MLNLFTNETNVDSVKKIYQVNLQCDIQYILNIITGWKEVQSSIIKSTGGQYLLFFSHLLSLQTCFPHSYLYTYVPVRDGARFKYKLMGVFNLQKNNTNQLYESDFLNAGSCSILREYMTLQDVKHIIITVHTWTAFFLKHLANMSIKSSFQA